MNAAVAEQIRNAVEARLRELQPVLTELRQLRGVLAALDEPHEEVVLPAALRGLELVGQSGAAAATNVTVLPSAQRFGGKPGRDGRAPQGANKRRILAVIAEHPGIAAPRIAALTGLKRPVVASTISRLKRTGELEPCGEGVQLPPNGREHEQTESSIALAGLSS